MPGKGTWLERPRMESRAVILFINCWSKNLATINFSSKKLSIGHTTVVDFFANFALGGFCGSAAQVSTPRSNRIILKTLWTLRLRLRKSFWHVYNMQNKR